MSEFWPLIALKIKRRGPHGFTGCGRVGWCSPLQIFLVGDLPQEEYCKSLHEATCLHARNPQFNGRRSEWHPDGLTIVDMYGNAQKPNLKGGAACILGTKYYSE
jgi:hypothetical protein